MNGLMPFVIHYYRIRTARTYKERLGHKFVFEITFAETISLPDGSIYGPRTSRMWELRSQRSRSIFHTFLAAIVRARRTCVCNCDAPDRPSASPSATCTFCRRKVHASILPQKIHWAPKHGPPCIATQMTKRRTCIVNGHGHWIIVAQIFQSWQHLEVAAAVAPPLESLLVYISVQATPLGC